MRAWSDSKGLWISEPANVLHDGHWCMLKPAPVPQRLGYGELAIYLDGVEVHEVTLADEEQGFIRCAAMRDGEIAVDATANEVLQTVCFGEVKIVRR